MLHRRGEGRRPKKSLATELFAWLYVAWQLGFQTADEAKAALSSEQFEEWRSFFGYYSAGGLRSPSDEVADLIGARIMRQHSNREMAETHDFMLFPTPVTEEELENKRKAFAAGFRVMAGARNKARK